ncbi:MAG: hypothetical protein LUI87_14410 [Lachnospiraceae bacterium]|nr:hypothetical protein [Lachnospiraceae bacterium]
MCKKYFMALSLSIVLSMSMAEGAFAESSMDSADVLLESMVAEFDSTISAITEELENVNEAVGGTYEGYDENKQMLSDWYTYVISETTALVEKTEESAAEYYRLIAQSSDWEDAMDDLYDDIYDGAFEDLYDAIYEDLYDDVYDDYYDGIIDDAYDELNYEIWSTVSSECYNEWDDSTSDFYTLWSDAESNFYRDWSDISSEFYRGNFDIEFILSGEPRGSFGDDVKAIEAEFDTTIDYLTEELNAVCDSFGGTYDGYVANKQNLSDWYELAVSETNELFTTVKEDSIEYFRTVALSGDVDTKYVWQYDLSDYYRYIYEDAFTNYYRSVYTGLSQIIYREIYNGVVSSGNSTTDYSSWSSERSDCYSQYSEFRSTIYSAYSDAHSKSYSMRSAVYSGFNQGNTDIDELLAEFITEDDMIDGMHVKFKETMDGYIEFIDEFCEFMDTYAATDGTDTELMEQYIELIEQCASTMKDLSAMLDEEMNEVETAYYEDGLLHISQKLSGRENAE